MIRISFNTEQFSDFLLIHTVQQLRAIACKDCRFNISFLT